jgi:hypothetical protein
MAKLYHVVGVAGTKLLKCLHCGTELDIPLPIEIPVFIAMGNAFSKQHKDCPCPQGCKAHKIQRCTRCNEAIHPDKLVWLELSITDGKYYKPFEFPQGHTSQGAFPFGSTCVNKANQLKTNRL